VHLISILVIEILIPAVAILEALLLAPIVLHVKPDLLVNNLELLLQFLELNLVDLDCQAGERAIELLELEGFVSHDAGLFEDLLNLQFRERYFEVFAELHELS
jgi:hypothetical protein